MSVYIDRKFLKLLSPKLGKFAQRREDLYNFRCPFCGDSQKNQFKARGYIYRKKDDYFYKCQNCGVGHSMYNFINHLDPEMLKEYSLERFSNKKDKVEFKIPDFVLEKPVFKDKINLPKISQLEEKHFAREYCVSRQFSVECLERLYFAESFKKFVDDILPNNEKNLKENDPRLVIPFFDVDGSLLAVQGRALRDSKIRYITIKINQDSIKIFGLDTVNKNERVYVTEGPLDSLFIPNAVATADANLSNAVNYIAKDKLVLVFDNEPRNKDICRLMDEAIEKHFQICVWPEMMQEKDINDMILNGFSPDEIKDIIDNNTYVNLRAKFEFTQWKKI